MIWLNLFRFLVILLAAAVQFMSCADEVAKEGSDIDKLATIEKC